MRTIFLLTALFFARLLLAASIHDDLTILESGRNGLRVTLNAQLSGPVERDGDRWLRLEHGLDLDRPVRRLLVALPPSADALVRARVLNSEQVGGPLTVDFEGANGRDLVTQRERVWQDLRVLEIDLELLRSNGASVEYVTQLELEIAFEGAQAGFASRLGLADRNLLLNGNLAAGWAIRPQLIARDGEAGWDGTDWVVVPVSEEGVYQLLPSDLSGLGLDPALLDPAAFKLYTYNGRMIEEDPSAERNNQFRPHEIPMLREIDNDGSFESGERILFYGQGLSGLVSQDDGSVDRFGHFYDDTNNYLLLIGGVSPGLDVAELPVYDPQMTYLETPRWRMVIDEGNVSAEHSARAWFTHEFPAEGSSWSVDLPAPAVENADLRFEFDFHPTLTLPSDWMQLSINGQNLENTFHPHESLLVESGNIGTSGLELELTRITWTGILVYLDWLMLSYEAPAQLVEGELRCETPGDVGAYRFNIQNAPSQLHVFDVTHLDSLAYGDTPQVTGVVSGAGEDLSTGYPRRYFAATEDGLRRPAGLSRVQMPDLAAEIGTSDMIVIAPLAFEDAARDYAAMRNEHGDLVSRVVLLEDIYLKYNCGVADPGALRNFLRHELLEAANPADYVLFAGNGHYDYQGMIAGGFPQRVPAWYRYSTSRDDADPMVDDFFVRLVDEGHLDMAYGRIPANSEADLRDYTNKVADYFDSQDRDLWRNRLLFVADDEYGDDHRVSSFEFTHSQDSEALASQYVPASFQVERLYLFDYPSVYNPEIRVYEKPLAEQRLVSAMNEGVALVNFMGHGNNTTWTHEYVFTSTKHLPLLEANGRPCFFIAATCSWAEIDLTVGLAMPQQLIHMDGGGALGIVAATRKTGGTSNDNFVRDLMPLFLDAPGGNQLPLGEALRLAKNVNYDSNRQKYIYLGDPSLLPPFPGYSGQLTDLESNGQDADTLISGVLSSFEAQVAEVLETEHLLDGVARVEMRQPPVARHHDYAPYTVGTVYHGVGLDYEQPGSVLFNGPVSMQAGVARGSFLLPHDVPVQADPGQLRIYMVGSAADGRMRDAIVYHEVMIRQNTDPVSDVEPPRLVLYLNGPQWREDDAVAPNSVIYLQVSDSSGIDLSGDIGHRIEIELDGGLPENLTASFEYELDSYASGRATLPLPALEVGEHQLRARAWDNAGNPGYAESSFNLISPERPGLAELYCTPNPVRDETRFSFLLKGLQLDELEEMVLTVYTVRGRKIVERRLELEGDGGLFWSEAWQPRDDQGNSLARGVYFYRAKVRIPETVYSLADEDGGLVVNRIPAGWVETGSKLIVE